MKIENNEYKIESTNKPTWFSELYTDDYIKELYDMGIRIFFVMTPRQNYGKTYWALRKFKEINDGNGKLFKKGKWIYIRTTQKELDESVDDLNEFRINDEVVFKAKQKGKIVKDTNNETAGFLAPYKTATRGSKEIYDGIKLAVWDEAFTDNSSGRNKVSWKDDKIYNFTNTFLSNNPDAIMFIFTNTETKIHPLFKILGVNAKQKEHIIPQHRVHFRRLTPDEFDMNKRKNNVFGDFISEKTKKNVLKGEFVFDNDDFICFEDEWLYSTIQLKFVIANPDSRRHDFYYNLCYIKKYDYFLRQEYNTYFIVENNDVNKNEIYYSLDDMSYLESNNIIKYPDQKDLAYFLYRLKMSNNIKFQDGEIKNNMVEWIRCNIDKEDVV